MFTWFISKIKGNVLIFPTWKAIVGFKIDKNTFSVEGGKVFRLANVTDAKNYYQTTRFQNILDSMGVFEALKEAGIKSGDTIKVGHLEFEYYE